MTGGAGGSTRYTGAGGTYSVTPHAGGSAPGGGGGGGGGDYTITSRTGPLTITVGGAGGRTIFVLGPRWGEAVPDTDGWYVRATLERS